MVADLARDIVGQQETSPKWRVEVAGETGRFFSFSKFPSYHRHENAV
jgi:hypothetical protein